MFGLGPGTDMALPPMYDMFDDGSSNVGAATTIETIDTLAVSEG